MATGRIEPYHSMYNGPQIDELLTKVAAMGDDENGWIKIKSFDNAPYDLDNLTSAGNYQIMYYLHGPEGVNISPGNVIVTEAKLNDDTEAGIYQFFYLGIPTFVYYRKYNTSTNSYGDWNLDRNAKILSSNNAPNYYLVDNKTLWLDTNTDRNDSPVLKVYTGLDENDNPVWKEIVPMGAMKTDVYDPDNILESKILTEKAKQHPNYDSIYSYIDYAIREAISSDGASTIVDDFLNHIKDITTPHVGGYFYNNKFYQEEAHTTLITADANHVYVDLPTGKTYRYASGTYTQVYEPHILDLVEGDPEKTSTIITERDKWNNKYSQQDIADNIYNENDPNSLISKIIAYINEQIGGSAIGDLSQIVENLMMSVYGSTTIPTPDSAKGLLKYFAEHTQLEHPTEDDINKLRERLKFISNTNNTYGIFTTLSDIESKLSTIHPNTSDNYHDGDVLFFKYGAGTTENEFDYIFYQIKDIASHEFIPINLSNNISIRWENITNKPSTVAGYGLTNDLISIDKYNSDYNSLRSTINTVCDISSDNVKRMKSNYDVLLQNARSVLTAINGSADAPSDIKASANTALSNLEYAFGERIILTDALNILNMAKIPSGQTVPTGYPNSQITTAINAINTYLGN